MTNRFFVLVFPPPPPLLWQKLNVKMNKLKKTKWRHIWLCDFLKSTEEVRWQRERSREQEQQRREGRRRPDPDRHFIAHKLYGLYFWHFEGGERKEGLDKNLTPTLGGSMNVTGLEFETALPGQIHISNTCKHCVWDVSDLIYLYHLWDCSLEFVELYDLNQV